MEANLQKLPSSKHDKGRNQKFKEKDRRVCCKIIVKGLYNNRLAKEGEG